MNMNELSQRQPRDLLMESKAPSWWDLVDTYLLRTDAFSR